MPKLSITDLSLKDKKVLMRVDFNVPMDAEGIITDDTRIRATLPSIKYVLDHGGSLILMSHLGRPDGKYYSKLSLRPCANRLSQLLGRNVIFAPDCVRADIGEVVKTFRPGHIMLLENLRFHRAEEFPDEDKTFAEKLSKYGDVYVNDAFGTAHRSHSSTTSVAKYFPGKAAAGFLLEKEIKFLGDTLKKPKRPFCAIVGGSKISSKCGVIEALLKKADIVMIGGGMAYTFFKAQGFPIGNSIHEDEFIEIAKELIQSSGNGRGRLMLPSDIVVAKEIKVGAPMQVVKAGGAIPDGFEGVDIGPETVKAFSDALRSAATVFWNGPLGVFEIPAFAKGTNEIAHMLAKLSATTIVGGGDLLAAVQAAGIADKLTHLSTGGGATLEYIEYGTLPGIEALSDKS